MGRNRVTEKKSVIILHVILAVLETIAAVYMLVTQGLPMFRYYTVDSNTLQLAVSLWYLICFIRRREIPRLLTVLHLVSAVCLTITFLIAAFVLMPQSTFAYYFLNDVAPIYHFLGPLLGVITLMLSGAKIPGKAVFAPAAATLLYGFVLLILNIARVVTGPYFFLEVYSTPVSTIVMWFIIIFLLCMVLSVVYILLHRRLRKNGKKRQGKAD